MSTVEIAAERNVGADDARDIILAEIVRNALASAAREMNDTLVRSAYNPLIFDVKDFGVGITSATGDLWADAPGLPVFTGVLPASIKSGIEKYTSDGFVEGDVLIANSPYMNGTHISDTAVYMPVFFDGELVAFTGSMAHWADIGGMSPGGWTVNSTDIFQEGIRFTHQHLYCGGQPHRDILDLIEENVRVSSIVMGDVHAQIATCRTGAERIQSLCARYGPAEVTRLMAEVLQQTETALHAEIQKMPDGTYTASAELDFNGVDHVERPVVSVTTRIENDRVLVSFQGTSDVSAGPINCGAEATAASVAETIKGMLDPLGTANQAHLSIAEIQWPDHATVLSAAAPAPCDSYGYVLTALVELMQLSLAAAAPDRVRAGSYQMVSQYIMSTRVVGSDSYVLAEPIQGGHGAFPNHDGACMMFTGDGDASNTPIEVLEIRYPVLCEQFSLDEESAGAGQYRGGMGVRRDLKVLRPHSMVKTALENTRDTIARGVQGGRDGGPGRFELHYPDGRVEVQPERISDAPVPVGTVLAARTGGGGGFGDPMLRDPQAVAADVRDDYISAETAREVYGVQVVPGQAPGEWLVDAKRTDQRRDRSRQQSQYVASGQSN